MNNKKTISKATKWALLSTLCIWGFISFMMLAGEENPLEPMSLNRFILIKLCAAISAYLCYLAGKWLYKSGYLPDIKIDDDI